MRQRRGRHRRQRLRRRGRLRLRFRRQNSLKTLLRATSFCFWRQFQRTEEGVAAEIFHPAQRVSGGGRRRIYAGAERGVSRLVGAKRPVGGGDQREQLGWSGVDSALLSNFGDGSDYTYNIKTEPSFDFNSTDGWGAG